MLSGEYILSQFSLAQTLEFFLRIVVAGVFGAAIGFERTRRFKEAGIRTHVIVCTASALLMLVSKYGFTDMIAGKALFEGSRGTDPARIAAQVISGISFLGAGVIFKNGSTVKGLTTAAGIWATAGIGLAVGAGMYWLGLFTTVLIATLQYLMHRFTVGADSYTTSRLHLRARDGENFQEALQTRLKQWHAKPVTLRMSRAVDGVMDFDLTLRTLHDLTPEDLMAFSREHSEILEISNTQLD